MVFICAGKKENKSKLAARKFGSKNKALKKAVVCISNPNEISNKLTEGTHFH